MQDENQQDLNTYTAPQQNTPEPSVPSVPPPSSDKPQPPSSKRSPLLIGLTLLFIVIISGLSAWQLSSNKSKKSTPVAHKSSLTDQAKTITTKLVGMDKQLVEDQSKPKTDDFTATAKERLALIDKLLEEEGGPKAVLALSNPGGFANAPAEAQQYLETAVELVGLMNHAHGHKFENDGKSNTEFDAYFVGNLPDRASNSPLYITDELPAKYDNSDIDVTAVKFGEKYVAQTDAISKVGEPKKKTVLAAVTPETKNVALIIVNLQNKAANITAPSATAKLLTDPDSTNQLYRDSTNDVLSITGKAFGPYTVSTSTPACNQNIVEALRSLSATAILAEQAAVKAGDNINGYNNKVYYLPVLPCGWGGVAWIGASGAYVTSMGYIVNHELGHNFALYHANTLTCTDKDGKPVTIGGTKCTSNEYGDPFSVMGNSQRLHNIEQVNETGFLDSSQVKTVDGVSGTYAVAGTHTGGTPQLLRIRQGNYALEYRQPKKPFDDFGTTDKVVNGVTIRQYGTSGGPTLLLDMTPETGGNFYDSALAVNKTFTDPFFNFTVKTVSITPGGNATVQIDFTAPPPPTPCTPASPTVVIDPASQWANPGDHKLYTLNITNNDNSVCPASTFNISKSLPSGFTQTLSDSNISLAPGAKQEININVKSAKSTAIGYYSFSENIARSGQNTVSASANYNIGTPPPPPPPPSSGSIKFVKTVVSNTKTQPPNNTLELTIPTGGGAATGNRIIISVSVGGNNGTQSCSDNKGSSYNNDGTVAARKLFVCSAHLTKALVPGDKITIKYPSFSGSAVAVANEFSGIATTDAIDGIFRSDSASSKNVVIDPALVTTAKSLIFGAVTSKAFTIGSGFTKAGDTGGIYPIYQITSAAGSYSTLGTSSGTWRGLLIAYKAAP